MVQLTQLTSLTQRSQAKLFCIATCVIGAMLCAWSHVFVVAAGHLMAAILVWRGSFGQTVDQPDMDALLHVLRSAEGTTGERATLVKATVHSNVISAPMVLGRKKWTGFNRVVSFRDEFSPMQWREVSTRLRHQPPSAPPIKSHR